MASAHCFASLGFCHPMTLIAARTAALYAMMFTDDFSFLLYNDLQCLYFFSRLEQVNSRAYKSYNFIHSCAELKILLLCADRFL